MSRIIGQQPFVGVPRTASAWIRKPVEADDFVSVIYWLDDDYNWNVLVVPNESKQNPMMESYVELMRKEAELTARMITDSQADMNSVSLGDPVTWRFLQFMEQMKWRYEGGRVRRNETNLDDSQVIH